MTELCFLCQIVVDEDDTYQAYRKTEQYKKGEYPKWSYVCEGATIGSENLKTHLINFHRLPSNIAIFFVGLKHLGQLLKEHPEHPEFTQIFPLYACLLGYELNVLPTPTDWGLPKRE